LEKHANLGSQISWQREEMKLYEGIEMHMKMLLRVLLERRIEQDYGLPKSSVQINRPDGRNTRSDKKIGNL
jgi:hypothetical protein